MKEDEHCAEKDQDKNVPPRVPRKRNETIYMKILVPSCAVGAIIGKGGESIGQVQHETGALIKLSKPNDLYPGTVERVCLIQGTLEGVTKMHNYIMDRMLEKPDCTNSHYPPPPTSSQGLRLHGQTPGEGSDSGAWATTTGGAGSGKLSWGRHQQVKILVPNCTAGLVIGKVGSYVKEIKERTGAFIQISQKSLEVSLVERCITIAGEPDQCREAVGLVLAKIAEDPQSTSCPTISYSHVRGPVASAYPTGSPFAATSSTAIGHPLTAPNPMVAAAVAASQRYPTRVPVGANSDQTYLPSPVVQTQSPLFQAALIQAALAAAAAGIDHSRSHYYTGYPTASPQAPPPSALMFTSSTTQCGGGGSSSSSVQSVAGCGGELGVYHTGGHLSSPPATQLIPTQWSTSASVSHLSEAPSPAVAYDTTGLVTPLNIAYYSANQPILTSVPSRHHSDVFPAGIDLYSTSSGYHHPNYHQHHHAYTSPSMTGTQQLYNSPLCHTSLTDGGGSTSKTVPTPPTAYAGASVTAHPQQQQLSDLFSALQLASAVSAYNQVTLGAGDQASEFSPPLPPSAPVAPQPTPSAQLTVTAAMGAPFSLQPAGSFAMPQFLPPAAAWYPPGPNPLTVDHRALASSVVDPSTVVPQQQVVLQPEAPVVCSSNAPSVACTTLDDVRHPARDVSADKRPVQKHEASNDKPDETAPASTCITGDGDHLYPVAGGVGDCKKEAFVVTTNLSTDITSTTAASSQSSAGGRQSEYVSPPKNMTVNLPNGSHHHPCLPATCPADRTDQQDSGEATEVPTLNGLTG